MIISANLSSDEIIDTIESLVSLVLDIFSESTKIVIPFITSYSVDYIYNTLELTINPFIIEQLILKYILSDITSLKLSKSNEEYVLECYVLLKYLHILSVISNGSDSKIYFSMNTLSKLLTAGSSLNYKTLIGALYVLKENSQILDFTIVGDVINAILN